MEKRFRFPVDELKYPWLQMLLQAYAIIDEGVSIAIDGEAKARKVKLACRKGCGNCCRSQTDIPMYPLERTGIYWYATEKITGADRNVLIGQLLEHGKNDPCPFLIEDSCSIHNVRPVSCRQFNVFGTPCAEGEDPFYARRQDVVTPIKDFTNRAFAAMLPFYGESKDDDMAEVIIGEIINTQAANLQSFDWGRLAGLMKNYDSCNVE